MHGDEHLYAYKYDISRQDGTQGCKDRQLMGQAVDTTWYMMSMDTRYGICTSLCIISRPMGTQKFAEPLTQRWLDQLGTSLAHGVAKLSAMFGLWAWTGSLRKVYSNAFEDCFRIAESLHAMPIGNYPMNLN